MPPDTQNVDPHKAPMPRDKGGWQVAPAPDGRGMPDQHRPTPPHRTPGFVVFVLVLLALNVVGLAARSSRRPSRG